VPGTTFRTQAGQSDPAAVESLVRSTGVFNEAEIAIARELVEENLARGGHASGYHFLFVDGADELLGYTCFGPISGTAGRYELYWIAVGPQARRGRLGQELMTASEEAVRALGGVYLFAETSTRAAYTPARRFYEAQNYKLMAEVRDWYADDDGLAIYGKRLT
jgi:ribosomal protein S18 acetylase RimI-like enzyme